LSSVDSGLGSPEENIWSAFSTSPEIFCDISIHVTLLLELLSSCFATLAIPQKERREREREKDERRRTRRERVNEKSRNLQASQNSIAVRWPLQEHVARIEHTRNTIFVRNIRRGKSHLQDLSIDKMRYVGVTASVV
jgi:hypothetical protein